MFVFRPFVFERSAGINHQELLDFR